VLALHNPAIRVRVLDRDVSRIASWKSSHLPIHEPGLEQVVRIARDGAKARQDPSSTYPMTETLNRNANLFFSNDSAKCIGEADIIFLAVNTPTKRSGRGAGAASDLSALEGATRDIAMFAKNGAIIVEKSTVPCGTAHLISDIVSFTRIEGRTKSDDSSSPHFDLVTRFPSFQTQNFWLKVPQ
jgi:UDPglucose 6-dehydrogenase